MASGQIALNTETPVLYLRKDCEFSKLMLKLILNIPYLKSRVAVCDISQYPNLKIDIKVVPSIDTKEGDNPIKEGSDGFIWICQFARKEYVEQRMTTQQYVFLEVTVDKILHPDMKQITEIAGFGPSEKISSDDYKVKEMSAKNQVTDDGKRIKGIIDENPIEVKPPVSSSEQNKVPSKSSNRKRRKNKRFNTTSIN